MRFIGRWGYSFIDSPFVPGSLAFVDYDSDYSAAADYDWDCLAVAGCGSGFLVAGLLSAGFHLADSPVAFFVGSVGYHLADYLVAVLGCAVVAAGFFAVVVASFSSQLCPMYEG